MGKQRGARARTREVRDLAALKTPLIPSVRTGPSTLSKEEQFEQAFNAVPEPERIYRYRVKEPVNRLYGEPITITGTVGPMQLYNWLFLRDIKGDAFMSGHLLTKDQWDSIGRGDLITCVARRQRGTKTLYVTEVKVITPQPPALEAAE